MPELVKRLWQVFKPCHQYNLKLNKSKCEFGVSKISILEHIVLANDNLIQQKRKLSKGHLHRKMSPIFDLFSGHVVTWLSLFQITPILQSLPECLPERNRSALWKTSRLRHSKPGRNHFCVTSLKEVG